MKNLTFKKKLILFGLAVGIIPLVFMALITYKTSKESLEESIYRGNEVFLVNSISKIESFFHERVGDAEVLVSSKDVIDALKVKNEEKIKYGNRYLRIVKESYGYSELFVIDTSGKVIIATDEVIIGVDLSANKYLTNSLSGKTNWSNLTYSPVIDRNVMVLSAPIKENGSIVGAIGIVISQESLNGLIHNGIKALGDSGDAYIVNADKLLYSETLLGEYIENAALNHSVDSEGTRMLSDAIKNNDAKFINVGTYLDYLNNPVLGAVGVARLGDELVGLVIEVDVSEAMVPVFNMKNIMIGILLGAVVLIIIVSIFIIKSILKPVKNVNAMLKDIGEGEGDLTKRLHINTKDEFGELGQLLNKFIIKLQELIGGISIEANSLAAASTQISASIDNSNQALESINSKTAVINIGTSNNASVLEETNASLEEIASSANIISEKANEVSEFSNDALKATRVGASNLEIANESVLKVQDSSN